MSRNKYIKIMDDIKNGYTLSRELIGKEKYSAGVDAINDDISRLKQKIIKLTELRDLIVKEELT